MKLLLDTHFVLAIVNGTRERLPTRHRQVVEHEESSLYCSTASLWEIAIKYRLGKLELAGDLQSLGETCKAYNIEVLPIEPRHVLHTLTLEPTATRDPFDRLLLAQAECEAMQLLTLDHALCDHPLAWRPVEGAA